MTKTENDMSDEELEAHEQATAVVEDKWDRLELLRRELNSSRVEQMYVIKRSTKLGPTCPYYLKAHRLFIQDQQKQILEKLRLLVSEFTDD